MVPSSVMFTGDTSPFMGWPGMGWRCKPASLCSSSFRQSIKNFLSSSL